MNSEAINAVSATVVLLIQVAKAGGITGRWALIVAAIVSALGIILWAVSTGTFARETLFQYFSAWVAVFTSATGVYSIVRAAPEAVTTFRTMVKGEQS